MMFFDSLGQQSQAQWIWVTNYGSFRVWCKVRGLGLGGYRVPESTGMDTPNEIANMSATSPYTETLLSTICRHQKVVQEPASWQETLNPKALNPKALKP